VAGPRGAAAATATAARGGEGLSRADRVRRRPEYLRAYRRGRRRTGALVILHFVPNEVGMSRVGVTVSRKVGNSVVRHRVKRRLLEAFRRAPERAALPALDLVLHVRPEAAGASYAALRQDLRALLAGLPGAAR
jgi:ribonuclease P protein component